MSLRNYLDKIRPNFEEGGKLHAFKSVYDGFETFLYVPNETSKSGSSIHDAIDSKRIMSLVVLSVVPAMLFGMYNIGYQNALAAGKLADATCWGMFLYGMLALLPNILVSYIVGLGIEFAWAQWKGEEIQEGYLVSGILIPLIVPVTIPLWTLVLAVAFAVIFTKEIFGGTGMNIFNVALAARAFLFFSYPSKMTGDSIWVAQNTIFGLGYNGNPTGRNSTRNKRKHIYLRHDRWTYPRFCWRNISHCYCNRCNYSSMDKHCQLENNVERIPGWNSNGTSLPVNGCNTNPLVRTSHLRWFLFRCSIYGNRPCDLSPYRGR